MAEWGYIALSRKFFQTDPWWNEKRPRTKAEAWIDCIQMAAWRPRRYSIGNTIELLQRGELLVSLRFLSKRWKWDKMKVSRWLASAEKVLRIVRQREIQGGTVYLLVNYDVYNPVTQPSETASETPKETDARQRRDKTEEDIRSNKTPSTYKTPSTNGQQVTDEPNILWID